MVRLFHCTALADDHTVVSLMVLQVVVVLAVGQGKVSRFRQQQLLHTVFIEHVAAIVRRFTDTSGNRPLHHAQLRAVRGIDVVGAWSVCIVDAFGQI